MITLQPLITQYPGQRGPGFASVARALVFLATREGDARFTDRPCPMIHTR